jgi:DNA modification methylase
VELYQGDCRKIVPLLRDVHAVVADPFYGIGQRSGTISEAAQHKNDYRLFEDTLDAVRDEVVPVISRLRNHSRTMIVTPGSKALFLYPPPDALGGFYQPAAIGMCSWGRQTFQPILYYGKDPHAGKTIQHTTYTLTEAAEKNGHPCPKPIKAWKWVVSRASCPEETVLDPYMGSGTSGVACVALGRRFVGVEIHPVYFDLSKIRIVEELEKSAFLEGKKSRKRETSTFAFEEKASPTP